VGGWMRNARMVGLGLGVGLLALSGAAMAQVQFGNLRMTANGSLDGGYNAASGDQTASNHGFQYGGNASIDGFYYNPRFFSFDVRPYYDQSRANSEQDSIFDSSGVSATAQIFAGSHFPGTIGVSEFGNKSATFGMANGPNVTTDGKGHGYNIGWSELLPGFPTFTAAFSSGTGTGSVLGAGETSTSDTRNLNLRSNYSVLGFHLTGMYQRTSMESTTPGFVVGTPEIDSSGRNDTLSFQVTHSLPWHGTTYGDVSKTNFDNTYEGVSEGRSTMDMFNGGVFLIPTLKSSLSFNGSYSNNLYGSLNQSIANGGVAPPLALGGAGSNTYTVTGGGSYEIHNGLYASANLTHVGQDYSGGSYEQTYFTGTLYGNYRRPLFGVLNWSVAVIDNANQEGNGNVGLNTAVSASRRFNHWEAGGEFAYQQNVATMLVGYNQSSYRWSSHVNRRADHWYWSAGVGGGQSLLTGQSGSGNHSENVFTALGNGRYSANVNYSLSSGTSVLTSNGLQSVTLGTVLVPTSSQILYNAHSFGATATASPKKALTIWASYSKASSMTSSVSTSSLNSTGLLSANLTYHARRLGFNAGFTRFSQSITAAGALPANVNSYYVGVNRWFSFF
jgi:hypothetical protein